MAFFAHKKGVYFPLKEAKLLWVSDDLDAVDEPFKWPDCQLESYKDGVEKLECGNFSEILNPTTMSRDTLCFDSKQIAFVETFARCSTSGLWISGG